MHELVGVEGGIALRDLLDGAPLLRLSHHVVNHVAGVHNQAAAYGKEDVVSAGREGEDILSKVR